jgi:histidine triad (HIT) family protein
VAPIHFLVVLKVKRGLTSVSKAEERHEAVIGHLMITASKLAEKEGCAKDGYRVVINEGLHGGLSMEHFFLHVIGGKQLSWPPGV